MIRRVVAEAKTKGLSTLADFDSWLQNDQAEKPVTYGGHTPSVEITHESSHFFVDAGTGLREAGSSQPGERKEFQFFLTHLHWDHLSGLPFFVPIFTPGNKITIYHVHKNAPEYVKILFNGINFPVTWEKLGATVEFKQVNLYQSLTFGPVSVTPFALDHPGGSFGYRFEAGGKSLAIGFDGEFIRISRKDLGKDLPYYQNLDLLVFDAQYEIEEYVNHFDWGHSSTFVGVDLALREGIGAVAMLHHDPWASHEKLQSSHRKALAYMRSQLHNYADVWAGKATKEPRIISAYDGLAIEL